MTIALKPTTGCNLGCSYCYENPDRERKREWVDRQYDLDAMIERLESFAEKYDEVPTFHGGEPLLMRKEDLTTLLDWIAANYERGPGIQTNGTLVDDQHIELFREYDVGVGVSCDGPPELNTERKAAGERGTESASATHRMSERTNETIKRLIDAGVGVGVITVLHKTNAGTDERFEQLLEWLDWLTSNDVYGHFNPAIPYDNIQNDISLTPETLKDRYLQTYDWMKGAEYRRWDPIASYVDNLLGNGIKGCVNQRCDVFNTRHAKAITGDGGTSGCGKTWEAVGDGVPFLQGPSTGNLYEETQERYEMLKRTPGVHSDEPDMGGCKDCEYWKVCQGGCPASGINDDHRNRSIWCPAKYALYERIERDLRTMIPNVRLMTDLPWDVDLEAARDAGWNGNLDPFGKVDPGSKGPSSAYREQVCDRSGNLVNRLPDEAFDGDAGKVRLNAFREEYPDEIITMDNDRGQPHADSSILGDDRRRATSDGWVRTPDEEDADD